LAIIGTMDIAPPVSDKARQALGFLTEAETAALDSFGAVIPCPQATLVSPGVALGPGVVLWPGAILQIAAGGSIAIGDGAILFPGARIVATGGEVAIGANAEIGDEGGFTVKAEAEGIVIGRDARLLGGGSLTLRNRIGDGAQIIGPIRCQNCTLGPGGSYRHPIADERGAVLKGAGVAREITLSQGLVIQAFGLFADATVRQQSFFHPHERSPPP
jgi:carbonic anhydrase/acetyltransferase-like protein (isoleucine patch superfamily)